MSDEDAASEDVEGVEPDLAGARKYPVMVYVPLAARRAAAAAAAETAASAGGEAEQRRVEGFRLTLPVAVMLATVCFAGGFWVGVTLEKDHSNSIGRSSSLPRSGIDART